MSRLDNYLIEQFTDINYNNLHSEQQVVIYEEFTVPKLNSDDSVITISDEESGLPSDLEEDLGCFGISRMFRCSVYYLPIKMMVFKIYMGLFNHFKFYIINVGTFKYYCAVISFTKM